MTNNSTSTFPDATRLGLIADTHVPDRSLTLNPRIIEFFQNVDIILHAGDISSPSVIETLETLAPTLAVQGNNRGDRLQFHPPLPDRRTIEVAHKYRIGFFHGLENVYQRVTDVFLGRAGLTRQCANRLLKRVKPLFPDLDCTVYGHGHWPQIHFENGFLFVNQGKAFGDCESSCAIMDVEEKIVKVQFFPLGNMGRIHPLFTMNHEFPR